MNSALITVLFFAGIGATDAQLTNWTNSLKANRTISARFQIEAVRNPSLKAAQTEVLKLSESIVAAAVKRINDSPSGSEFLLAGHSSGTAISNEIARRVKDKSKVKLVVLDGFIPNGVPKEVSTTCWSARSPENGTKAPNHDGMSSCENFREILPRECKTPKCLHFSVINYDRSSADWITQSWPSAGVRASDDKPLR